MITETQIDNLDDESRIKQNHPMVNKWPISEMLFLCRERPWNGKKGAVYFFGLGMSN